MLARERVLSPDRLKDRLNDINGKVVFTNGCFDILHIGHLRYLEEAKKLGDILVVGVNSDDSVKRLKGEKRPINKLNERMEMLAGLKPVDYVTYFEEDTPYNLIKLLVPDILVKGGDWKVDEIVGSDIVLDNGGEVFSLNFEENFATTNIIEEVIRKYCK
ncbi:MAG: D-glycero-beta-D-manno-heptose 1-phosphate adenylyltransferase [Deferribacterales bacterium]|uniref:D-glycero-beta-D-manno-heptose 1-phosphate adenylyltransferase n=1 Tax=Deferrivibrio essentukiensis TaxID=2880922 RepID=UPI0019BA02AB|nr:D-glycero-beta-D-manno-heptose 1-phosphate adenylyltransferase [Deferribacterales bacterium]MCB4204037.1 D-glycero-beta-D-manno-heptose 1-phosphate adenylyltransferase [Deferrivibrio essentukiensis]